MGILRRSQNGTLSRVEHYSAGIPLFVEYALDIPKTKQTTTKPRKKPKQKTDPNYLKKKNFVSTLNMPKNNSKKNKRRSGTNNPKSRNGKNQKKQKQDQVHQNKDAEIDNIKSPL